MRQATEKNEKRSRTRSLSLSCFMTGGTFLGGNESFCARENAASSLSVLLEVIFVVVSDASLQPRFLTLLPQIHPARDRTRSRSLSHTEKFSAEEPMARSALAVSAASPNTRSPQAATTVITTITEQLRRGVKKEVPSWQKTSSSPQKSQLISPILLGKMKRSGN